MKMKPNPIEYATLKQPQRCKNCRYGTKFSHIGLTRVECRHVKVFNGGGLDNDGAAESYADELHFGPDFGCIHWEEWLDEA